MLKLHSLFSDHCVLQRRKSVPVWGTGNSFAFISATLGDTTVYTRASLTGAFRVYFPPMEACSTPMTLTVTDQTTGETASVQDILVGEVWLASGQSNMEYALGSDWVFREECKTGLNKKQLNEFMDTTPNPERLRAFLFKQRASLVPEDEVENGRWIYLDRENGPLCSAIGAWFAKFVQEHIDVPMGIVVSNWGGTFVQAWTSREATMMNPASTDWMLDFDRCHLEKTIWVNPQDNVNHPNIDMELLHDVMHPEIAQCWESPDLVDCGWKDYIVPDSWRRQEINGHGAIWARRKVTLPDHWAGKPATLHLGGIDKHDITYFNGTEVGRSGKDFEEQYWNVPRAYPIPANMVHAGQNTIAVRAFSFLYDGAIGGKEDEYFIQLDGTDETIPLAGTWKALGEYTLATDNLPPVQEHKVEHGCPNIPTSLFNGMINPLIPYALRGILWYQGENNAHSADESRAYANQLSTMIQDWRFHWGCPDMQFIQVELASYGKHFGNLEPLDFWPLLRDSQHAAAKQLKYVYTATAIDIGDPLDVHPQDKKSVGYRMAKIALNSVYHRNVGMPTGPTFIDSTTEGNTLRIRFGCARDLVLKPSQEPVFFLAGQDKQFHPAETVTIDGTSLVLASTKVPHPVAARYAWANNPICVLYNGEDLPASPFRTDDWEK